MLLLYNHDKGLKVSEINKSETPLFFHEDGHCAIEIPETLGKFEIQTRMKKILFSCSL